MPVPNASLTPDETVQWSPSGPAALALTTSGALRVQRPRGPLVQAGTVNRFIDPFFTAGVGVNIGPNSVGTVISTNNTEVVNPLKTSGHMGLKVVSDGISGGTAPTNAARISSGNGVAWAISADICGDAGKLVKLVLSQRDAAGGVLTELSGPIITLTGTPVRYAATFTTDNANIAYITTKILSSSAGASTFYADRFQVEQGTVATEFVNPDDPDTYWLATANASPSARPDRYAELANAWLVEEATTNLIPNSKTFDGLTAESDKYTITSKVDSDGYTAKTITRIASGGWCAPPGATGTFAAGSWVVLSIDARGIRGGNGTFPPSIVYAKAAGGSANVSATRLSPATPLSAHTYERQIFAYQFSEDATVVRFNFDSLLTNIGNWVEVRKYQIETKAYPTSYADSTMGTGYSAGTGEVSVRAASRIYTPATFDVVNGSVYIRFLADNPRADNAYILQRGNYGNAGSDFLGLRIYNGTIHIISKAGTAADQYAFSIVSPSGVMSAYAEYTPAAIKLFVNGVDAGQVTSRNAPIGDLESWDIGSWNGNNHANAYVFAVATFPRPLTEDEIAALEAIPTEDLSYASIVGIGPQLGGLLLTHPDPGFAVLRTHGGM